MSHVHFVLQWLMNHNHMQQLIKSKNSKASGSHSGLNCRKGPCIRIFVISSVFQTRRLRSEQETRCQSFIHSFIQSLSTPHRSTVSKKQRQTALVSSYCLHLSPSLSRYFSLLIYRSYPAPSRSFSATLLLWVLTRSFFSIAKESFVSVCPISSLICSASDFLR